MSNHVRGKNALGNPVRVLAVLLGAAAVASAAEPAAGPAGAPTEPKTHTLFMGADVSVEQDKKLYPVKNVTGAAFIITPSGAPVAVPMRGEAHGLNIARALKLTAYSVSLTGLKSERAYTRGNDPRIRRQREAALADMAISDNAALAIDKYSYLQTGLGVAVGPGMGHGSEEAQAAHQADLGKQSDKAMADFQRFSAMQNSEMTSGAFYRERANSDMSLELFDAVEVSFEVSSPNPLREPYLIIITRFHEKDAKPGQSRNAIFATSLDPIVPKPRRVELLHGGFPPGFVIEELDVHLYSHGEEIATNVVSKRVPLTRDEAFKYVEIEYLSSHKGMTVSATPALGRLSVEARATLTSQQISSPYFVRVSKDGIPLAAFSDKACTQPVDPVVEPLIANVRFNPALENGKPVEGTARLVFTQLRL